MWMSCFGYRINKLWHQHHLLEEEQHGSRADHSCDTAILILLNSLETAREWCSNLLVMSLDIAKAFDSVSRGLQMFAWKTLGVPSKLAEYIVNMDVDGHTIIRAPIVTDIVNKIGRHALLNQQYSLKAWKGLGQGDPTAPSGWSAAADISLRALKKQPNNFFVQTSHGTVSEVPDLMYVDDQIVLTGDLESMQAKADMASAVNAVLGISFAIPKIRAAASTWGNLTMTNPAVTLHDSQWRATSVDLPQNLRMKYLGLEIDLSLDMSQLFKEAKQQLRESIATLETKSASPESLHLSLVTSVYPQLAWKLRFFNSSLKTFRSLDGPINSFLRRITKSTNSFPTSLLYLSKEDNGLGFKRFSTYIQLRKLAMVQQLTKKHNNTSIAINSLLTRQQRLNGHVPIAGEEVIIRSPSTNQQTVWATSLVQYLKQFNVQLRIPGAKMEDTAHESVIQYCSRQHIELSKATMQSMIHCGISNRAELLMEGDDPEVLTQLRLQVNIPAVADQAIFLRTGQVWCLRKNRRDRLLQIIGFDSSRTNMHVIEWHRNTSSQAFVPNTIVWLYKTDSSDFSRGAGSVKQVNIANTFEEAETHLINLGKDSLTSVGNSSVILTKRKRTPRFDSIDQIPSYLSSLNWFHDAREVYTDGSWNSDGTLFQHMRGQPDVTASASLVKLTTRNNYSAIKIITNNLYKSAFEMELMALAACHLINRNQLRINVHSDSQSAIQTEANSHLYRWKAQPFSIMTQALAFNSSISFSKVKAHIDQRQQDASKWTLAERGNVMADMVAGPNSIQFNGVIQEISDTEVLQECAKTTQVHLVQGDDVFMQDLVALESATELRTYINKRDQQRTSRVADNAAKWTQCTIAHASHISKQGKTVAQVAALKRTVWDKHITGHRVGQFGMFGFAKDTNIPCLLCDTNHLEDQRHILDECMAGDLQEIRDESDRQISALIQQQQTHNSLDANIMGYYRDFINKPENVRHAYTGMFPYRNLDSVSHFSHYQQRISTQQYNKICKLGNVKTNAAVQLMHRHRQLLKAKVKAKNTIKNTKERVHCAYNSKQYKLMVDARLGSHFGRPTATMALSKNKQPRHDDDTDDEVESDNDSVCSTNRDCFSGQLTILQFLTLHDTHASQTSQVAGIRGDSVGD